MRSPTNAILTGLAIADLLVMLDYIPFIINDNLYPQLSYTREEQRSYVWAIVIYFHAFVSQTGHTISIALTVILAVWRYIAIAHPQKNLAWCNMQNTFGTIIASYFICALLCMSIFFIQIIHSKVEVHDGDNGPRNVTLYVLQYSYLIDKYSWIWPTYIWCFSVLIKIIPSIALTFLSLRLVGALLEAKHRRKQLMGFSNEMKPINSKDSSNGVEEAMTRKRKRTRLMDKEQQTDRTTRMLLAVLLLFLITEIPQGILGLISATSKSFYAECHLKLGEFIS